MRKTMKHTHVAKVEAAWRQGEHSFRIGPGRTVNLDERIGPGVRIRDAFKEEWFEPIAAPERPAAVNEE